MLTSNYPIKLEPFLSLGFFSVPDDIDNSQSQNSNRESIQRILVTGATGYIGGRLVPRLLDKGYQVRAAARSVKKLQSRPWGRHPNLECVPMDVFKPESIQTAMQGCDVAYYLVHSMVPGQKNFEEADRKAAQNFTCAAELTGIKRIIHLSGLGEDTETLSKHLASRAEVAKIFRQCSIPSTIFRAAMIIGSGSASFEIMRYLVERLPVMLAPRWVNTPTQPISIRNVMTYLIECLEKPETFNQTFDIGGHDIVTYQKLMEICAEEEELPKRLIVSVPVFTPKLSSYWIHLVTPVGKALAQPLAEGLRNKTVCQEDSIQRIIPQELISCREAIRRALDLQKHHVVETRWTDAGELPPLETIYPGDPGWAGGTVLVDRRVLVVSANPADIWARIAGIGGDNGWYYGNFLWKLRGLMDAWIGGVGLRRGRRDPYQLQVGDALDFWRVLDVEIEQRLFLKAEMKLPGEAYLEFVLKTPKGGQVEIIQTATYVPKGLPGILYWYAVLPFHHFVFNGMLMGLAKTKNSTIIKQPRLVAKT
jgi:uncharacterized protein YbjT (DUF2867 family)